MTIPWAKNLSRLYGQNIEEKNEILEDIKGLILFKEYFQSGEFYDLIKQKGLESRTLEHIKAMKNRLDFKLDFIVSTYPDKTDFDEIMNEYKKLDLKTYRDYIKRYNDTEE